MRTRIFLPTACCLLLTSCFSYKEVTLREIRSVELEQLSDSSITFTVQAVIDNPNGYRIKARDTDLDLYVNGAHVGKATIDTLMTLDRRIAQNYTIPVQAQLRSGQMMALLLTTALSGRALLGVKGSIRGQVGLFKRRFPFEMEQEVVFGE
jgi:LEA14-like dessication related protein